MSKYFNHIRGVGTVILIILLLTNCRDHNPTETPGNDPALLGEWVLTEVYIPLMDQTIYDVDLGFEVVFNFEENGNFLVAITENGMTETENGTWTTASHTITMKTNNGEEETIQYSVEGNAGRIYNWSMKYQGVEINVDINFVRIMP